MNVKQVSGTEEKRLVHINIIGNFDREADSAVIESEVYGDNVCLQDCMFTLAKGVDQIAIKIAERTNVPKENIMRIILKFIEMECK